ncbi:MAG: hypothetical protein ACHQHN_16385 [Sphingobacteriales bacterium]
MNKPKAGVKQKGDVKPKTGRSKPKTKETINFAQVQHPVANSKLSRSDSLEQTEEMEGHHHPQLEHTHKPWKEYLLEGFMIFIAVMMGFIAENIREDITNNQHAQQLTKQLVHDLKADTVLLNNICRNETQIIKCNDTLILLLQQPLQNADTRRIQKLAANSHSMWPFRSSSGSMDAIKNELHLKQFSNSDIINYFSKYERHTELLYLAQNINLEYQRTYLDPFITQHFTPANMIAAFNDSAMPNAQMRELTQRDMDQLAADMVLIRIISKEIVIDNRRLMGDATGMLKYVKAQYHPEE